jgi:hypothetical protein
MKIVSKAGTVIIGSVNQMWKKNANDIENALSFAAISDL